MLLLCLFVSLLTIINTDDPNKNFCDIKKKSCDLQYMENKFIFYVVNQPEGFNLRRDVYMRYAIMLHEASRRDKSNWQLVLPPWYQLNHWKSTSSIVEPIPWSAFFEVDSLKEFAPVIDFNEFMKYHPEPLMLDRVYMLKNFEDAFENGIFTEKWEIMNHCNRNKYHNEYKYKSAKEIICVKFQGKVSKLWEIIALHPKDKYIMFVNGEIPLHYNYGTKTYWDCRKSMKFSKPLKEAATQYILKHFNCKEKCSSYIGVHWRRQDFSRMRTNDVPSIVGTAKQIDKIIKNNKFNTTKIFIATDATQSEINKLEYELNHCGLEPYFYVPTVNEMKFQDGGVAIIEQIICSHAVYFIGTHESTFTFRIQEEREILGLDTWTTFNRLCPDDGECEKPARWTIVN